MTIGLEEAGRRLKLRTDVRLAVDVDAAVVDLLKKNVPNARAEAGNITTFFPGELGARLTDVERKLRDDVGLVDVMLGGPPCQGHSDLNNRTRRNDPRNALYVRMARAAEVLTPKILIVENVPPVQWDKNGVVTTTSAALRKFGYEVAEKVIDLSRVGVPQKRRRHFLFASKIPTIDPSAILRNVSIGIPDHPHRTVRWAIEDLLNIEDDSDYNRPGDRSDENVQRMRYLFEKGLYDLPDSERPECHRSGGHSYASVYGRLRWDEPAQTITTGFGSMGQGRFVHPQRRRTLTPHEAARLQTFPDWYVFSKEVGRGLLYKTIGNAVPPLIMVEFGLAVLPLLGKTSP